MKKIILITFLFYNYIPLWAQSENINFLLSQKLSFNIFKYWGHMTKERNIISSGAYTTITNFQNEKLLPNSIGIKYGVKLTFFPFILEGFKFDKKVKIKNPNNIGVYQSLNNSLKHSGWDFSVSICPLPYINQLSERIIPYVGIGYQLSEFGFGQLDTEFKKPVFTSKIRSSYLNSSACTWKIGCSFSMKQLPFYLVVDYEQSWHYKNDAIKFSNVNIGLFVNIMLWKYKDKIILDLPH